MDKNIDSTINEEERQMKQLASEARKINGFNRIDKEDVERAGQLAGTVDDQEAYLAAVKEYLKREADEEAGLRGQEDHWFEQD